MPIAAIRKLPRANNWCADLFRLGAQLWLVFQNYIFIYMWMIFAFVSCSFLVSFRQSAYSVVWCTLRSHYCARLAIAQWINSRREKKSESLWLVCRHFNFIFSFGIENVKLKFSHFSNNNNNNKGIFAAPELRRQFNHQLMMLVQHYLHWKFILDQQYARTKTCTRHARRQFYEHPPYAGYVLSAYTQITLR